MNKKSFFIDRDFHLRQKIFHRSLFILKFKVDLNRIMELVITGRFTFQVEFLNRGKYEGAINRQYCLYTIQVFYLFHVTVP